MAERIENKTTKDLEDQADQAKKAQYKTTKDPDDRSDQAVAVKDQGHKADNQANMAKAKVANTTQDRAANKTEAKAAATN